MYDIIITRSAGNDLEELYLYVELNDSIDRADMLLASIERVINDLKLLPERGHYPPELLRIAVRAFREVRFKPYRIIYTLQDQLVVVHCILDGRRDMQSLLQERLLR